MSNVPTINEIDETSPSQNSETVVASTNVIDNNEIQETISATATIEEIDNTCKPTISEIYKIVTDGLFESTTNWWDYAYKLSQAQINQDIISRLDKGEIGGGYSKGVNIITTTSSELPTNVNVYSALKSDSLYPKKLVDENINGIYDFLNGITVGKPTTYTGGQWSVDNDGKTHFTTDYLYVRLKAIFETLQILNVDTIGGKLVISPAGSINIAYVDEVTVTIDDVEQKVYRCYFLGEQDGEEIDNKWKVGDQAQAKSFNVKKGTYHNTGNHYLWRLVVGVDSEAVTIDNKKYHYVDLSQLVFDTGSNAPCPGDVLNQLGYRGSDDAQRQSAIVLNAVDTFAPSITLYAGINDFTLLNKEYVDYGVINGKAFFNVYGDMYVGERGTNPTTYIKYANGKINIKANLEIGSSIGDKDLNQYIKDNAGLDEAAVLSIVNNAQVVKDLQKQVDGAIETWFYEGEPKLTNLPASDWTDDTTKENHVGDLYYDQSTGYAYRFTKYNTTDNPYGWNKISDSDITKALEAADVAQATADHKMKVYYGDEQPTDYQAGDIWVNATLSGKFNNDIARATTSSNKFNANHWVLASRYSESLASLLAWSEEYETKFSNLTDEVKAQKDQSIIVWYYEYAPTVSNAPANDWNTSELRSEHIGDIFYDIKNNHSYRWTGSDWAEIKDADFTTAMSAAKDAQDTADSKRRVFYSDTTPSEPYDEGDLWVKKVDGKTETWIYNGTNWTKTESKELSDFSTSVTNQLSGIQSQIDGKAETWYQNTDPSTNWSDSQKSNHVGDLWYNTTDGTTQYWNGTTWEQMDIPKDVFDTIDGKASIFVDSYTDAKAGNGAIANGYNQCDLWILPEDATVNGTQYYKGDLLTATEDCTTFNESHWTKKVRYVGQTELADNIKVVNEKINNISASTLPGLEDKFTEFTKDGILDSSEIARLTDTLAQMQAEYDAVNDQINTISSSTYLTNSANKTKLIEYQGNLKTAWTTYSDLIKGMINGTEDIDKTNIAIANTRYNNLVNRIKEVQQTLTLCQSDIYTGLGTDLSSYKYLKQAFTQDTDVIGGLILTSAIQLRDTDSSITAGMNGIVDGDITSIAAWYGGPMVDRDTLSDDDKVYTNGGTKFARSLFRHDGSGYLSSGAIWWGTDGVLHGDPNSFILQGSTFSSFLLHMRLFYLHYSSDTTTYDSIDYITPTKTFSRLQILPHGGTEGSSNLPTGLFVGTTTSGGQIQIGNIILTNDGDNILKITNVDDSKTANVCSSGGVTAYGVSSTSSTGGGGLQGTVIKYSDAIGLDTESMSQIASAYSIASLSSRIDNISTELSGINLSWSNITGKPSTYTPSAHTHVWKDIIDAPSNISSFTNDAGYLTTTDASTTYLTKTDASTTYQAKGSYAAASHNHDSVYSKLGHTHNYASSVKVGDTSYDCTSNVISLPAYPTSLPASDVYSWAKAASKPSYSWSEITDKPSSFTPSDHTHTFASLTSKPTTLSGYGITDGLRAVTQPTGSNVFVTAISTSGTNITYTKSYTKKSLTAVGTSGWTNASTDSLIIPDMSFIAYWNGAYASSGASNLQYCYKGKFGDFATKSSLAFSELTSKPTTISGYGITDAYTKTQIDSTVSTLNSSITTVSNKLANYLPLAGGTITGNLTVQQTFTLGSIAITYDSTNKAIKIDGNLYATGGITAYGEGSGSSGGGGLNGTIIPYATAIASDVENESTKIATASSIYKLHTRISDIETNGATSISVTGSGNAVTAVSKSGTAITFTKGSTFLTSHQSLADYVNTVTTSGSGNAVTSISKSGSTVTVTKGTTFLTSHQDISGKLNKSGDTMTGVLTVKGSLYNDAYDGAINMNNSDIYGLNSIYTSDESNSQSEGIHFWRDSTHVDTFRMQNGKMFFAPNRQLGTSATEYTVIHTGNISSQSVNYANSAGSVAWGNVSSKPTTLSGYGITDGVNAVTTSGSGNAFTAASISGHTLTLTKGATYLTSHQDLSAYATQSWVNSNFSASGHNHNSSYSYAHQSSFAYNVKHDSNYVTFDDPNNTGLGYWVNGFVSTHNNYLSSYIINLHRTNKWYVGYSENETAPSWDRLALASDIPTSLPASDVYSWAKASTKPSYTFSEIGSKPTTLAGYGITDAYTKSSVDSLLSGKSDTSHTHSVLASPLGNSTISATSYGSGFTPKPYYASGGPTTYGNILEYVSSITGGGQIAMEWTGSQTLSDGTDTNVGRLYYRSKRDCVGGWTIWKTLAWTSDIPTSLKNPYSLSWSGYSSGSYDGSSAQSITIPSKVSELTNDNYTGTWCNYVYDLATVNTVDTWVPVMNSGKLQHRVIPADYNNAPSTLSVNYATSAGNADTVEGYHASDLLKIKLNTYSIYTSGTAPYNYIWLFRIGNSYTYSTVDVDIWFKSRYHCNRLAIRIATGKQGYNDSSIMIRKEAGICDGEFWYVKTANTSGYDYYDVYYKSGAWNSGGYQIEAKGSNGMMQFTHKGTNLESLPSNCTWIPTLPAESCGGNSATATKLQTARTIWGQSFDGSGNVSGTLRVSDTTTNYREGIRIQNPDNTWCTIMLGGTSNEGTGTNCWSIHRKSDNNFCISRNSSDGANGLVMTSTGMGLGTTSPSYRLHVAGTIYSSSNILAAGGITAYSSSDIRLKTNIHELDCLGVIKSIGGTYEFDYLKDGKHSIGFIAQRVNNPLLADILGKDDDGYLKINYWSPKLISLAFGALTEVDDEVERLKARVRELESEVEYLKMK